MTYTPKFYISHAVRIIKVVVRSVIQRFISSTRITSYRPRARTLIATSQESLIDQISLSVQSELKEGSIEVPLLPEVASKVVRLTQNPDSDAVDLARLIQSDLPLAGHVMHVANSAVYSPNASLVSLQQAITRLGMRVIAEIALAASINSKIFDTPGYESHIQYILKCSLAAGLWAKETARACRKNVEAAFLAGLLNDIGRPVAVQTALKIAKREGLKLYKTDILEVERRTKREIGMAVLEEWEMPITVKDVIRFFDSYREEHAGRSQTMIVVAGSVIANHFYCDSDQGRCLTREELITHPVFGEMNLYQDEIEELLEKEDSVDATLEASGK